MTGWWRRLLGFRAVAEPDPSSPASSPIIPADFGDLASRPGAGGPLVTRDAVWEDVELVTSLLGAEGVDYVLVGGYALAMNGLVRLTGDIDIVVRNTPDNNVLWIEALSKLPDGATSELRGETMPFPSGEELGDEEPGVLRVFDVFVVDVMPRACGLSYEDLEPYIVELREEGRCIRVLNLEGLLLTKRGLRSKDVSDRQQIEMALSRSRSVAPEGGYPKPESRTP